MKLARREIACLSKGTGPRAFGFYGNPGNGKSAIIETLAVEAGKAGYVSNEEAPLCPPHDDFRPALWEAIGQIAEKDRALAGGEEGNRLFRLAKAANIEASISLLGIFNLKAGGSSGSTPAVSLYEEVEGAFAALGEAASKQGKAVLIALDEVHHISSEGKTALIYAMQKVQRRRLPLMLVMAGLPELLDGFITAKAGIGRSWEFQEVGPLPLAACRSAFVDAAAIYHEKFEDDALDLLVRESDRSPFLVQTYGQICWEADTSHDRMTLADAETAIEAGNVRVDRRDSFFGLALRDLGKPAIDYLLAMAAAAKSGSGSIKSGDIDAIYLRHGRNRPDGKIRPALVDKGLVHPSTDGRGRWEITQPGLRAHLMRRLDRGGFPRAD